MARCRLCARVLASRGDYSVPPFALDATIFADYEQLKRFFYFLLRAR
jgi:hypothetical protein